ncbi:MAG: helix-turn-helix domain-containing protein [Chloroflexota bacterium]
MDTNETTLNSHDRMRLNVVKRLMNGQMTVKEAAAALDLSTRQVWRIIAAYKENAVAAILHGNRGRTPTHAISTETRRRVVDLARTKYAGHSHQQLQEALARQEGITISRSTVRNILLEAGIRNRRGRRSSNS